jgi:oxygen-independent coproporphyrinogen-3 oxidase
VSLEANPGTVDLAYLRGLLALGINRLSLGVQSFHDDELSALDRVHSTQQAREAYRWAQQAGFRRLNLDLIYGLPNQPLTRWQETLEAAIALGPDHLSLYALTVEEGTKLAYDIALGRVPEPDQDAQAEMYEWSRERLAQTGYGHYEISNWARPNQECRHNLTYWRNGQWLGLGAGAHSHFRGFRFADVYSTKQYMRRIQETVEESQPDPADTRRLLKAMRQVAYVEEATPALAMADTVILALRLHEGISLEDFRRRFGRELTKVYGPQVQEMASLGLLELAPSASSGQADSRLRLTSRGRLLANQVFLRFLPD